jgi:glucokinase
VRVGLDLGGTKCLGVSLDPEDQVIGSIRRRTPDGPAAVVHTLAEVAEELGPYRSLGIGVPGLVSRSGTLHAAPNLSGIELLEVRRLLEERLGHEVAVDNDATCATLAEWRSGAGVGTSDLLMVTLGTGIGGGAVLGGRLQHGRNGFAGEYGHMVVNPNGPRCVCGRRGCWERYASGAGLAWLAHQAAAAGRARFVVELAGGLVAEVRGEHVQRAARQGDPEALAIVDSFGRWVALGLANLSNALDPELIVVGGGLIAGADLYIEPIRRWFAELLYSPTARPHPRIEPAHWDERAGAVGAALLGGELVDRR